MTLSPQPPSRSPRRALSLALAAGLWAAAAPMGLAQPASPSPSRQPAAASPRPAAARPPQPASSPPLAPSARPSGGPPSAPGESSPRVERITFSGEVVDGQSLSDLVSLKVGAPYDAAAVRTSLNLLFQKGLYADIRVDTQPTPSGGLAVDFRFVRQHLLTGWSFSGNHALDAGTLARALDLRWGEPLLASRFDGYARTVQERYRREGYPDAQATFNVRLLGPGEAELAVQVTEGLPLRIRNVILLDPNGFTPEEILQTLKLGPGSIVNRSALSAGIERLNGRLVGKGALNSSIGHYFELPDGQRVSDAALTGLARPDWVDLALAIESGQPGLVHVDTDVPLPVKDLSEAITVYTRRSYSAAELEASAQNIQALYVAKGYPETHVRSAVTRRSDGGVLVTFYVQAGPAVRVQAIRITGNTFASSDQLRSLLTTQSAGRLGGGIFVPEEWDASLANLIAYYRSQGFLEAKIERTERLLDASGQELTLVIHLHEGPRSVVSRLIFEGASPAQEGGILQALPLNPGDPYNPARLADWIASVEAYYAKTGYPLAEVHTRFEDQPTPEKGTLIFSIAPHARKRLGALVVRGNLKTHDSVVRRQLTIAPGNWYNSEELLLSQRQLYQLGFFDRVDLQTLSGLTNDPREPIDMVIALHERETGWVGIGGGYGTYSGPQASAEFQQNNLYGTGRPLRLEGVFSAPRVLGTATLRDPYLFGTHNVGEAGVSYLLDRSQDALGAAYQVETYGPTLGLTRQISTELVGSLRYSWGRTAYRGDVSAETLAAAAGMRERTNSVISSSLTYDTRADFFNPRYGTRAEITCDLATPLLGGSLVYARPRLNWTHFIPLPWRITLALGSEVALIQRLGGAPVLPPDTLFILGKGNTVRGATLDPTGGPLNPPGQAVVVGHGELRFPLRGELGGVAFVDAGNVWSSLQAFSLGSPRLSAGLGLRYMTPVGPIRVDYAVPLQPQAQWPGFAGLSFGLGQAF